MLVRSVWIVTLAFLLFVPLTLLAQTTHIPSMDKYKRPNGLNPHLNITQYVNTVWQAQQGLPQNSAYALCQTRDGYLWIGTEEGAARFDGVQFKVYDKDAFIGLSVGYTISFCEQRDGTFWMGTRGGGLIRLVDGKYTLFDSTKGINAAEIWCILEDRAGTLWIGTENGLFAYSGGKMRRFTTADGLPHLIVYTIYQDRMGTLWVGTQQGLCRLNAVLTHSLAPREKFFAQEYLPNNDTTDVRAILHDSKGTLHIGTHQGLWSRSDGGAWRFLSRKDGLSGNYVYALLEDRSGALWAAMFDNGISRIYDNRIDTYTRADGLVNENTLTLLEDHEGALWVGTYGGGVQRFTNGSCINMASREGLVGNVIRSFAEDSTGGFWIGSNNNGLQCLRNGKLTLYDHTKTRTFAAEEMRGLYTDPDGTLWAGVLGEGVYYWKNGRWGNYSTKDGLASNDVYAIVRDTEGAMWFGGSQYGISRLKNGQITKIGMRDGLLNESVYGLLADSAGGLWIGSFGGGVQYYRNGKFTNYGTSQGLLGNNILTFYQDASGSVWVGGVGGISRIKKGVVRTFTKKEGLYNESAFTILEDDLGYLWATSNKGVYRFRRSEADSVADGLLSSISCRSFGIADGMHSPECNGGAQPSAIKARDGRLWFSTIEGAVIIDPRRLEMNYLPPTVIIESVLADTTALDISKEADIAPDVSKLQFNYTATSLLSADRVRFRFLLEGFDREWTDAGIRRIAYYTNLPHGRKYRFRVQACNNDGVWNDIGATYSFRLRSYFYETWWFLTLCGIGGIGIILAAYTIRVHQIQSQAHILETLVQERTKRLQQSNEELAAANAEVQRQVLLSDMQAREIEVANGQLQESNERLKTLDKEKNEFLGIAAHDLKNPLSSIIMTVSMMERYNEKIDPKDRITYLQRIEGTAERMLHIITDLLNINEIESGSLRLHLEPIDLAEVAADAAQHYQMLAQRKNIRFVTEFPDHEVLVMADKEKLWEVMENLLSNALKFSPIEKNITVRVTETATTAHFEVHDQGPGLDEADMRKLFTKFARLSAQPTAGEHSTGLGLSIVKKMIEAMNGSVWCESKLGTGARFIVELPKVSS